MTLVNKASHESRALRIPNRNGQLCTKEEVNEEARKARHTVLGNMDAIASGVEAWFEENTGYLERVGETTVQIARGLGVPEAEIERWISSRPVRDMEKGRAIKSLLERMQQSFDE